MDVFLEGAPRAPMAQVRDSVGCLSFLKTYNCSHQSHHLPCV